MANFQRPTPSRRLSISFIPLAEMVRLGFRVGIFFHTLYAPLMSQSSSFNGRLAQGESARKGRHRPDSIPINGAPKGPHQVRQTGPGRNFESAGNRPFWRSGLRRGRVGLSRHLRFWQSVLNLRLMQSVLLRLDRWPSGRPRLHSAPHPISSPPASAPGRCSGRCGLLSVRRAE